MSTDKMFNWWFYPLTFVCNILFVCFDVTEAVFYIYTHNPFVYMQFTPKNCKERHQKLKIFKGLEHAVEERKNTHWSLVWGSVWEIIHSSRGNVWDRGNSTWGSDWVMVDMDMAVVDMAEYEYRAFLPLAKAVYGVVVSLTELLYGSEISGKYFFRFVVVKYVNKYGRLV